MSGLILLLIVVGLHGFWIYKLATYNWDNFEEDSKNDNFLKPYD
jgi:hypothetical protein